jgi:hypothetical protein
MRLEKSKKFKKSEILEVIKNPARKGTEFLTGLLATNNREKFLVAGRLLQGTFNFSLIDQFKKEINELIERGKIKENYYATKNQQATLIDIFNFIDNNPVDEELFNAFKLIFLKMVSVDSDEKEEKLGY